MSCIPHVARRARRNWLRLAPLLAAAAMVAAAHHLVQQEFEQRAADAQALRLAELVTHQGAVLHAEHGERLRSRRALRRWPSEEAPAAHPVEKLATRVSSENDHAYRYWLARRAADKADRPSNDFEQWAWLQLARQAQAWRFVGDGPDRMLQYMRKLADPHPGGEQLALAVWVPVRRTAPAAALQQLLLTIAASSAGIGLVGHCAWRWTRRERRVRDQVEATLLLRTSALHSALGDAGKALEFARAALDAARRSREPGALAAAEECMGDVLCAEGRSDDGVVHWRAALQLLRNRGRHRPAARLCGKLADMSVDKGAGGDAVRWQRRAAELELKALDSGEATVPPADAASADVRDGRWHSAEMAFHTAKMAAVGRMVAGVNHELKQPLVSLRLLAASALERLERAEIDKVRRHLNDIQSMADQIARLTTALDNFSRKQPCQPTPTRLSASIGEALTVLGPQLHERRHDIKIRGVDPEVWVDHDRMRLILVNLLSNAVDATSDASDRRIEIEIREDEGAVTLRVRDFGKGFPPEVQQHLFDMFVTTKAEGRGLGLGLALCAKMAREMGGMLTGRNHPQGGAEFTLVLPQRGK